VRKKSARREREDGKNVLPLRGRWRTLLHTSTPWGARRRRRRSSRRSRGERRRGSRCAEAGEEEGGSFIIEEEKGSCEKRRRRGKEKCESADTRFRRAEREKHGGTYVVGVVVDVGPGLQRQEEPGGCLAVGSGGLGSNRQRCR